METIKKSIYLLSTEVNYETVIGALCDSFGIDKEGMGNVIELKQKDINLKISVIAYDMTEKSNEFIDDQIQTIWNHFQQVDTDFTDIKMNLLYQIRATSTYGLIVYSYEEEGKEQKEKQVLAPILAALDELSAILLVEKGTKFLDKEGKCILSDEGESQLESFFPYEVLLPSDFFDGIEKDRVERRARSLNFTKERNIYVAEYLPVIEGEEEIVIKRKEEIAQRMVALLAVSLYSECILGDKMELEEARAFTKNATERFGDIAFSKEEREYFYNPASIKKEQILFSWSYESLFVMEWAMGFIEKMEFPDCICDVPLTVRIMNQFDSMEELLCEAKPRTKIELLDEADLIYRLDWACVNARIHEFTTPANMDSGVVMERHKSLNWLIDQQAEWDDVDIST